MDYGRIYADFIASRRDREQSLAAYSERHHIIPKCKGGGNAKDNLISLTPEDHFFAHLLLAKIHGGSLWAVVALMAGGTRHHYRPTHSRKQYGWASRAMAKAISGDRAYQFDHAKHALRHADGREWCGLQSEMGQLGISKSLANMVVKGRVKSAKGWHLAWRTEAPTQKGASHPMHRKEIHTFCHADGREFIGTQFEFHQRHNIAKPAASNLARGKVRVWNGWHLKGAQLPRVGRSAKWARMQSERNAISTGSMSI